MTQPLTSMMSDIFYMCWVVLYMSWSRPLLKRPIEPTQVRNIYVYLEFQSATHDPKNCSKYAPSPSPKPFV
jgi:hypothetical protein